MANPPYLTLSKHERWRKPYGNPKLPYAWSWYGSVDVLRLSAARNRFKRHTILWTRSKNTSSRSKPGGDYLATLILHPG